MPASRPSHDNILRKKKTIGGVQNAKVKGCRRPFVRRPCCLRML